MVVPFVDVLLSLIGFVVASLLSASDGVGSVVSSVFDVVLEDFGRIEEDSFGLIAVEATDDDVGSTLLSLQN